MVGWLGGCLVVGWVFFCGWLAGWLSVGDLSSVLTSYPKRIFDGVEENNAE